METIQWHLKAHGVFLDSNDDLDVHQFYQHLEHIVGHVADMIMDEIYENLRQRNQDVSSPINPDEPVMKRIEQLLAIKAKGGNSR
jgi:hypothetical protein